DPAREVVAGLAGPNDGPLAEPVELDLAGAGCGLTADPVSGLRGRRRGGCGSRRAAAVVDSLDGSPPRIRPQGHRPPADDVRPASWWPCRAGRLGRARQASSAPLIH